MDFFSIIGLFGGLALFLYGMRLMGDGLRQSSSKAFKNALEKLTNSPVVSFLVGLLITAIIQSSTATIVITSGLVGAGLMSLHQSLGIILGANVGTTITAQIIRLMDIGDTGSTVLRLFKPDTLAPIAAIIGILMIMFFKFKGSDNAGSIAMGFGILFTGLINMTAAVTPLSQSESFSRLFTSMADTPFLGFFAGAAVAFIIQSSSASIGILQALSITGKLSLSSIYAIIIGIYIGDCVTTAIVCSIGAKSDAKRVGLVHIMFNLCSVVLVVAGVMILRGTGTLDEIWLRPLTSGGIANIHTLFKLGSAIIVLPFVGLLEKVSKVLIKDNPTESKQLEHAKMLDTAFYRTPSLALSSAKKVLIYLAEAAVKNFNVAIDTLLSFDDSKLLDADETEDMIDNLTDRVEDYLIRLAPMV
ncbi:MAG: Na/Pi symporter, partial [Bacillota bacterium]|nr:Na/Pi symporter [Bacillota bacterium]